MSDLKDKIKASDDILKEIVDCPEWGVKIEVRTMSGFKRSKLSQECLNKDGTFDQTKWQAGIIINCCYDHETQEQLFTMDDVSWLMDKAAVPIERLALTANKLNGLAPSSLKDAENL